MISTTPRISQMRGLPFLNVFLAYFETLRDDAAADTSFAIVQYG